MESCTGDVENVLVDDCIGGPRVEEGSVVFNRCTFSNTSGSRTSEPVVYFAGEHRISDSKFVRNTSVGTVCQFIGSIIERSLFDGNRGSGWGVMAESSSFTNCVFTASSLNIDSSRLVNCTLGAHSFTGTGNSTIANCIIWSADSQTGPGVQINLGTIITHSLIYGGFEGEGNLDADPLFVDPASSNYRLQLESPCIDAGTEDIDDLPKTDIDGVRRVIGPAPDMGAYEHFGFPLGSLCPLILSGT